MHRTAPNQIGQHQTAPHLTAPSQDGHLGHGCRPLPLSAMANIYGSINHYSSGQAALFYGAGYLIADRRDRRSLAIIDLEQKTINYLDSSGDKSNGHGIVACGHLRKWLFEEAKVRAATPHGHA